MGSRTAIVGSRAAFLGTGIALLGSRPTRLGSKQAVERRPSFKGFVHAVRVDKGIAENTCAKQGFVEGGLLCMRFDTSKQKNVLTN